MRIGYATILWIQLLGGGTLPAPCEVEPRTTLDAEMFPSGWLDAPHRAVAAPLAPDQVARVRRLIRVAMAKYPPGFLAGNVDRIYLVGSLEFDGIHAAGTNSSDRVYVAGGAPEDGFTDRFIEETFHHELSSILLRRYCDRFPEREWMAAVPRSVRYGESGVDAVKGGRASLEFREELHRDGFIHEYAMATLEDDFNSIAENLFSNREEFWAVVERHPALRGKVELAVRFFRSIDAAFDEPYFRALKSAPPPPELLDV